MQAEALRWRPYSGRRLTQGRVVTEQYEQGVDLTAIRGIPNTHRVALIAVAQFAEGVTEELAEVLIRVRPNATLIEAGDLLEASFIEPPLLVSTTDLLAALMLLRQVGYRQGLDVQDLALSAVESIGDSLEGGDEGEFARRLSILLESPVIKWTAKAASLNLEHERTFAACRVVTDFRPSFDDDLSQPPTSGVIVHDLRLDFWRSGREETMYIGLDERDLTQLRLAVERAQRKSETLNGWLASAGVQPVSLEED